MNGHPRPRRDSARSRRRISTQRCTFRPVLLIAALLAMLLVASTLVAGCGSADAANTSTTAGPNGTTAPPTTAAPSTATTAAATFPATVTDDNGNSVIIKAEPMRIVSTAPASTETLFALGLGDRVVGVTSLCDYPPEVAGIAKIGDFQANTEAVMALSPDLVVGYSGNEEALAPVQRAGAAVIIFNPATLDGIYANIISLGAATGATGKAAELVASIKAQIAEVAKVTVAANESPKVFYALDNTLWTCGPGSFVDELLALVNATNVGSMPGVEGAGVEAYYQFSPEQLVAADPDIILLPNTAYASVDEFVADSRFAGLTAVKNGSVFLVDDVVITRPGARIGEGLQALAKAVHPGAF
jgi:iron complex transport system substrate-binding protein